MEEEEEDSVEKGEGEEVVESQLQIEWQEFVMDY